MIKSVNICMSLSVEGKLNPGKVTLEVTLGSIGIRGEGEKRGNSHDMKHFKMRRPCVEKR